MADTREIAKAVVKRFEQHQAATDTPMWMYICPDTQKKFFTGERLTSIISPYTGKGFIAEPQKVTL